MSETMEPLEKGYTCPGVDCSKCPLMNTDCIVFSKKGQRKYADWLKKTKKRRVNGL